MFACREGKRGLITPFIKLSNHEQELPLSSYETMKCFYKIGYQNAVKIHTFHVWVHKSDASNLVIDD